MFGCKRRAAPNVGNDQDSNRARRNTQKHRHAAGDNRDDNRSNKPCSSDSEVRRKVAKAAEELFNATGGPDVNNSPELFCGPLPPEASSTGRKYYAMTHKHPTGPCVICGQTLALKCLGWSWLKHKPSPKGFDDLESAVNAVYAWSWPNDKIIVRIQ